ncbi:MAG: alanine racemase [Bryobacteraceae bacterium]|nr:alanine racemase [Bryobacteraceae bacterium]
MLTSSSSCPSPTAVDACLARPQPRNWAEISRARLVENYRAVRSAVGPDVEVLAVVKADAYGHGAAEVSRLLTAEGAKWLGVSNWEEGVTLRKAGIQARILVMADILPYSPALTQEYALTPTVHSLEDLAEIDRRAAAWGIPIAFHLKVDTGMGRLGVQAPAAEIGRALAGCRHAEMEGLMTHFASSADYSSPQTDHQIELFEQVLAQLRRDGISPRWIHMASSNPVAYGRRQAFGNMVRVGHALYGYVSPAKGDAPAQTLAVQPVLTWKASILSVKDLPRGARVGYGGTFQTSRPSRIAVLSAGYADGVPHRLSNRGKVLAGGRPAPVIGAVSMDLTTIDITETPWLKPGDTVTLLGRENGFEINAQQIARWAGTISYVVLCGISARVPRVYV